MANAVIFAVKESVSAMMASITRAHRVKVTSRGWSERKSSEYGCLGPCVNKSCGPGVCTPKKNSTFEAVCSCPVYRKGDSCELPNGLFTSRSRGMGWSWFLSLFRYLPTEASLRWRLLQAKLRLGSWVLVRLRRRCCYKRTVCILQK